MSIEGQGHFFTIYFPGFVCFVLYKATISGERLQDHWSSGLPIWLNKQYLIFHEICFRNAILFLLSLETFLKVMYAFLNLQFWDFLFVVNVLLKCICA